MNPEPPMLEDDLTAVPPEALPDLEQFVIEDDKPVDNFFTAKQQRLLVEALRASWAGPGAGIPWIACSNVGLFYAVKHPPLAPDMMLALGVERVGDYSKRENRSYFAWLRGKVPDVVIEIVSDRRGGEATYKMTEYAKARVPYYVLFDPANHLRGGVLRGYQLQGNAYAPVALEWLPEVGLGLRLWEGEYEEERGIWLRWCDREGNPIPTGKERADREKARADEEQSRAEQQEERAELERQRAEQQKQRAEQEKARAEQAEKQTSQVLQEAERLRAKLRELGIDPSA